MNRENKIMLTNSQNVLITGGQFNPVTNVSVNTISTAEKGEYLFEYYVLRYIYICLP
jgi:hypothetical protein